MTVAEEFDIFDLPLGDDFFFDLDPLIVNDSSPAEDFGRSSPDSWIGEIELMSDENHEEKSVLELDPGTESEFIADLLVDYPTGDSGTVHLVTDQVTTEKETEGSDDSRKENAKESDDLFFDFDPSNVNDSSPAEDFGRSSPDSLIGDIESILMSDENHEEASFVELDEGTISEFVAELLVDYPTSDSGTADLVTDQVTAEKKTEASDDSGKENTDLFVEKKSNDSGSEVQDDEGDDDAVAKKRRRRLRNRDAAVRSRERKKEYVQDLEKKSKYLERECLRLGRLLECVVAENQSLRYSLQKGSGNETSRKTKQESAVLLLESLLLGSLLWLLGVNMICQFPCMSHTKCYLLLSEPEKVVLNGQGNSNKPSNKGVSRRCKGSRPRMKHQILNLVA